jgi:hypothetical protein
LKSKKGKLGGPWAGTDVMLEKAGEWAGVWDPKGPCWAKAFKGGKPGKEEKFAVPPCEFACPPVPTKAPICALLKSPW